MRQRVNMVEAVNLKKYAAKRYSLKFSLYFIFKYNTQSKDRKKKKRKKDYESYEEFFLCQTSNLISWNKASNIFTQ